MACSCGYYGFVGMRILCMSVGDIPIWSCLDICPFDMVPAPCMEHYGPHGM